MLRAVSGNPPRPDLAAVGDELPQQPGVLVVHAGDLLLAEQADLLLRLANGWLGHRGAPQQSPACGGDGRFLAGSCLADAAQKGGSSVKSLPPDASDAHGSSAGGAAPPPPQPPRPPPARRAPPA